MGDKLIATTETGTIELPLGRGTQRLGSSMDCDLQLAHPQVEQLALTLDYKGETLLFHNHNPYPIYLGDKPVDTGVWSPWPAGEDLRMTRDVTLRFENTSKRQEDGDLQDDDTDKPATGKSMTTKQMVNIGVICACAIIALLVLSSEPKERVAKSEDTFSGLVNLLQEEIADNVIASQAAPASLPTTKNPTTWQLQKALRLLQEAHVAELRMPKRSPTRAIDAYDLLLHLEFIADANQDDGSLARRLHVYAADRKEVLAD